MTLGKNISEIMKRKRITGRELAKKLETSESYISDIKNDKQDPSLKKLREIATALDVELHELVKTYREDQDKKQGISEVNYCDELTKEEKELIEQFRALPDDIKKEIKGEIKGILRMTNEISSEKRDII